MLAILTAPPPRFKASGTQRKCLQTKRTSEPCKSPIPVRLSMIPSGKLKTYSQTGTPCLLHSEAKERTGHWKEQSRMILVNMREKSTLVPDTNSYWGYADRILGTSSASKLQFNAVSSSSMLWIRMWSIPGTIPVNIGSNMVPPSLQEPSSRGTRLKRPSRTRSRGTEARPSSAPSMVGPTAMLCPMPLGSYVGGATVMPAGGRVSSRASFPRRHTSCCSEAGHPIFSAHCA
mmetsp:Transcript_33331/g.95265  ORF Transcript_33331/g.95265 Transcript_33331/m.95265 type:complete len:232 (-) Transcript_33331:763-1458(-)